MNPPLRTPADALACLAALADGTADAIATDHAPHAEVDKAVEFGLAANGISGLETALGVAPRRGRRRPAAAGARDRGADDGPGAGARRALAPERIGRAGRGRSGRPRGVRSRRALDRDRRMRSRRAARTRRCSGMELSGTGAVHHRRRPARLRGARTPEADSRGGQRSPGGSVADGSTSCEQVVAAIRAEPDRRLDDLAAARATHAGRPRPERQPRRSSPRARRRTRVRGRTSPAFP